MLTPEQAREQLRRWRDDGWGARLLRSAVDLSPAAGAMIEAIFMPRGSTDADERLTERRRSVADLREVDRAQLWALACPKMVGAAEQVWRDLAARPSLLGGPSDVLAPGGDGPINDQRADFVAGLCSLVGPYQPTAPWLAAWAPHLGEQAQHGATISLLLAAAIDGGGREGDEALAVLLDSAAGRHDIGGMGNHVIWTFLLSSRPEGWHCLATTLVDAQGEDGLRLAILERAHRGHPGCFDLLLRTILDHGLARFGAVRQAVGGWFDWGTEALGQPSVAQALGRVQVFLDDRSALDAALHGDDAPDGYLALWSLARTDGPAALDRARQMLDSADPGRRLIAVRLLSGTGQTDVAKVLGAALDDQDLRIAVAAAERLQQHRRRERVGLFEPMARLVRRLPKKLVRLPALVHPSWQADINVDHLAWWALDSRGPRPADVLLPLAPALSPELRWRLVLSIRRDEPISPAVRKFLVACLGDSSKRMRGAALERLTGSLTPDEAREIEALLSRTTGDLRQGAVKLLQDQEDFEALASVQRLLASHDEHRRLGGLELLRSLAAAERRVEDCRALAATYRRDHPSPKADEESHLSALAGAPPAPLTSADAFGLIDPADLLPAVEPKRCDVVMDTPAARALLEGLFAALDAQSATVVSYETEEGLRSGPLGQLPPLRLMPEQLPPAQRSFDRLPLMAHWLAWYEARPAEWRDQDGCELIRAAWLWQFGSPAERYASMWSVAWHRDLVSALDRPRPWARPVLCWLQALAPAPVQQAASLLLAATEDALARLPAAARTATLGERGWDVPSPLAVHAAVEPLRRHARLQPRAYDADTWRRVLGWQVWAGTAWSEPDEQGCRWCWTRRPPTEDVLLGYDLGASSDADVLKAMLSFTGELPDWHALGICSRRRLPEHLAGHPRLAELAGRAARRLLFIELARGDQVTEATRLVPLLRGVVGSDVLLDILCGLRGDKLRRVDRWDGSRGGALSWLLRVSYPGPDDSPERVGQALRSASLPERLLCEAAFIAPQWSAHLGAALGWPGFDSGVWWLHAHTKDSRENEDEGLREAWTAEIADRTPLAAADLLDGATDVAWFTEMIGSLGADRFAQLALAARLGSSTNGHTRARLFADAMLDRVDAATLAAQVADKRHLDALRALGLAPLPAGDGRTAELRRRYDVIVEMERTARQFGAQRQASETRAAAIALGNLARTAGHTDPLHLRWAMEALAVADLSQGAAEAQVGDTRVALSITAEGQAQITASKAGQPLRGISGAAGKDPRVVELKARKVDLDRAASRMSAALEESMCRGDRFTGRELRDLLEHPLLAPRLMRLVWLGEGIAGYPAEGGQALRDHADALHPLGGDETIRLAHPVDLLAGGEWHSWQRECLAAERVQPFKQVFREVYPLTAAERHAGHRTPRYTGHQLHARQALGLFGRRGWVNDLESGLRRTWHEAGLTGCVEFADWSYTPASLAGLTVTTVRFVTWSDQKPVPLAEVPPVVFSEAMRDLDLVVSVAHRGGVDPEATASTIELRAMLLSETCALMKLDNVRIEERHVFIDGHFGRYSVHLGSAVTHKLPGGMLFIVPVHSQHRGRLFLPFADDDPKTAEVLSKVLMLARDKDIKDPSILGAIRG